MKKVKILVLSHISDLAGGAEMSLLDTFDYWCDKYNIEPVFIIRQPVKALAGALNDRRWKYYDLKYTFWSDGVPPTKSYDIFYNALDNMKAVLEIEKIIQTEDPDVVMTNSIVSPWAAIAALYKQVPHIWFVREYGDLDHGRIFEIGREATFQDIDFLSDLVATNSVTLANHVKQYIPKNKVTTMYTPFKVTQMNERMREDVTNPYLSKNSVKLIMTGTLTQSKGQQEAVEAVGILNKKGHDVEICLVGGNPDQGFINQLRTIINEFDISKKVHFVGHQDNPFAFIRYADIGIMASRKEAFGRVTFEYLATGHPVVGADSGATPELIQDGHNGYLYKQGDATSLAKAIENYVDNQGLIKEHGLNAIKSTKSMMEGRYGADALFRQVEEVVKNGFQKDKRYLNYSHRTMEYLLIADEAVKATNSMSIIKIVKLKARRRLKRIYYKLKSLKAR